MARNHGWRPYDVAMMSSGFPEGLDVDYEIVRFGRRARAYAMGHIGEIHEELDYGTFLVLLAICDAKDGVRASQLADDMRVHKSTVSRAVASLERMGLIERTTHPDDARAQILTVPADARAKIEAFRARGHAELAELLSDWTDDEKETFARLLSRLNDGAEKYI